MGFLLLMLLGLIVLNVIAQMAAPKPLPPTQPELIVEAVKNCPPHKWQYHEVKDTDGNTVRWTIACDICGPLKPLN